MTNPLEGMKAVYKDKVLNIIKIDMFNSYFNLDGKEKYQYLNVPFHEVKTLLKFPDKDSEDVECWEHDLVTDGIACFLLCKNKYSWGLRIIGTDGVGEFFSFYEQGFSIDMFLSVMKRLCSIYDKEALDHLPEDVVNKLKETVK